MCRKLLAAVAVLLMAAVTPAAAFVQEDVQTYDDYYRVFVRPHEGDTLSRLCAVMYGRSISEETAYTCACEIVSLNPWMDNQHRIYTHRVYEVLMLPWQYENFLEHRRPVLREEHHTVFQRHVVSRDVFEEHVADYNEFREHVIDDRDALAETLETVANATRENSAAIESLRERADQFDRALVRTNDAVAQIRTGDGTTVPPVSLDAIGAAFAEMNERLANFFLLLFRWWPILLVIVLVIATVVAVRRRQKRKRTDEHQLDANQQRLPQEVPAAHSAPQAPQRGSVTVQLLPNSPPYTEAVVKVDSTERARLKIQKKDERNGKALYQTQYAPRVGEDKLTEHIREMWTKNNHI